MGSKNCPETPRQKMIGMMYLVLTAMLALNVSKEILSAFVVVDETLLTSNNNTMITIESDYQHLQKQIMIFGEEKVRGALNQADVLKKASDEMVNFIESMKTELLIEADGEATNPDGTPKSANDIEKKDDYSKPSNFFILQGKATQLKDEILKYRALALSLIPEKNRGNFEAVIGLNADATYPSGETWESHNFENIILVACVTLMNKMVGEVRNAESMVLKQIIGSIGAEDFKFDKIEGRAIPSTRMVFTSDNYEADIIVAAYDSKSSPEVYYKMGVDTLRDEDIPSANKLEGENGMVKLRISAGNVGDQKYAGIIRVKRPDGQLESYGFKDKYTVVKPSATVAADGMNVLYSGIENPISVSAPVDPNKLNLSIPGCNISSNGSGKYTVTVPASLIGKKVTATVSATVDNNSQAMGGSEFRVKAVPSPRPYIGTSISGGKRSKTEITAVPTLTANMGTDFVYDLKWNVVSYRVIFVVRNMEETPIPVSGAQFSQELIKKIQGASSGTVITFTDIKARSSAGERTLPEVTVRVR